VTVRPAPLVRKSAAQKLTSDLDDRALDLGAQVQEPLGRTILVSMARLSACRERP
jgi:hypothetical protein